MTCCTTLKQKPLRVLSRIYLYLYTGYCVIFLTYYINSIQLPALSHMLHTVLAPQLLRNSLNWSDWLGEFEPYNLLLSCRPIHVLPLPRKQPTPIRSNPAFLPPSRSGIFSVFNLYTKQTCFSFEILCLK